MISLSGEVREDPFPASHSQALQVFCFRYKSKKLEIRAVGSRDAVLLQPAEATLDGEASYMTRELHVFIAVS
jgi:hypothetical protein